MAGIPPLPANELSLLWRKRRVGAGAGAARRWHGTAGRVARHCEPGTRRACRQSDRTSPGAGAGSGWQDVPWGVFSCRWAASPMGFPISIP